MPTATPRSSEWYLKRSTVWRVLLSMEQLGLVRIWPDWLRHFKAHVEQYDIDI